MDDGATLDFLTGRLTLDDLSSTRRRRLAVRLPEVVACQLAADPGHEQRDKWSARCRKLFFELVDQLDGSWGHGWDDLAGALMTAVELLERELPDTIRRAGRATPAEESWRRLRRPFLRFALLAGSPCQIVRVWRPLGAATSVDARHYRGRSDELMRALATDDAVAVLDQPIAATGSVDCGRIRPVLHVPAKATAWFQRHPQGTLVTPPDALELNLDATSWQQHWVAAGTLAEAVAKLIEPSSPLLGWSQRPLAPDDVLDTNTRWITEPDGDRDRNFLLSEVERQLERVFNSKEPGHGLLVTGGPGSGKSTWSRALVDRARTGRLGRYGWWIRWTAGAFLALSRQFGGSWERMVAHRTGSSLALDRVIAVVDGLDELPLDAVAEVSAVLASMPTRWVALARPVDAVTGKLPRHFHLEIQNLEGYRASSFVRKLGREDLANRLDELPKDLTRSPLMLCILADLVEPGTDLRSIGHSRLYERLFERLVDQVSREARPLGAGTLRRAILDVLPGELSLELLSSDQVSLSEHELMVALEREGIATAADRAEAVQALAGGQLLVRNGEGWGFAHRSIAEWCAAKHVGRRIKLALPAATVDREQRAETQGKAIAAFVDGPMVLHERPHRELLAFLGPHLCAPLDFLLDATRSSSWPRKLPPRSYDAEGEARDADARELAKEWEFCFDIVAESRWREDEAKEAWALATRFHLAFSSSQRVKLPRAFVEAVGRYLPSTNEKLLALANLPDELRTQVEADPLVLLAVIPSARPSLVEPFLGSHDPERVNKALEWYATRNVPVPESILADLLGGAHPALQNEGYHRLDNSAWTQSFKQGMTLPLQSFRARILCERRGLVQGGEQWLRSNNSTSTEDRFRALGELVHFTATADKELTTAIAAAKAREDGEDLLKSTLKRFDYKDDRAERELLKEAWAATEVAADATSPDETRLRDLVRSAYNHRRSLNRACKACVEMDDDVLSTLWRSLPPDSRSLVVLRRAVLTEAMIPRSVRVHELLDGASRTITPSWRLTSASWTKEQCSDWKSLASSAAGETRLLAIQVIAVLEQTDVDELLAQEAQHADAATASLLLQAIRPERRRDLAVDHPDAHAVPLDLRVDIGSPQWRSDLIACLQEGTEPDQRTLAARLAGEHRVAESVEPLLRLAHADLDDTIFASSLTTLLSAHDHRGAALLDQALEAEDRRFIGDYVYFLRPHHIARLVDRAGRGMWMHDDAKKVMADRMANHLDVLEKLVPRLRAQRDDAARTKHAHDEERSRRLADGDHSFESTMASRRQLEQAQEALDFACSMLLGAALPRATSTSSIVELAFLTLEYDRHNVYGTPGPLGADFDDPVDKIYESSLEGEGDLKSVLRRLTASVDAGSDLTPARRLLSHPSETLRLGAFKLLASRQPQHELVTLAVEALEAHTEAPKARLTGETWGLMLAARLGGGSGEVNVEIPNVVSAIERQVLSVLTRAHSEVLDKVLDHPHPVIRAFGARWVTHVGATDLLTKLRVLLADAHPGVTREALRAMRTLAPACLPVWLEGTDRSAWSGYHLTTVLMASVPPNDLLALMLSRREPLPVLQLSVGIAAELLATAPKIADERALRWLFGEAHPLVERFIRQHGACEELEAAIASWSWHESKLPWVAALGRRFAMQRGLLETSDLLVLLDNDDDRVRCSGAELLLRHGDRQQRERASDAFTELLKSRYTSRVVVPHAEVVALVLRALPQDGDGISSVIAQLLDDVHYDNAECCYSEEDERTVDVLTTWLAGQDVTLLRQIEERVSAYSDGWELLKVNLHRPGRSLPTTSDDIMEWTKDLLCDERARTDPPDNPRSWQSFQRRIDSTVISSSAGVLRFPSPTSEKSDG